MEIAAPRVSIFIDGNEAKTRARDLKVGGHDQVPRTTTRIGDTRSHQMGF